MLLPYNRTRKPLRDPESCTVTVSLVFLALIYPFPRAPRQIRNSPDRAVRPVLNLTAMPRPPAPLALRLSHPTTAILWATYSPTAIPIPQMTSPAWRIVSSKVSRHLLRRRTASLWRRDKRRQGWMLQWMITLLQQQTSQTLTQINRVGRPPPPSFHHQSPPMMRPQRSLHYPSTAHLSSP